jgi:hypothetical protein
MKLSILGNQRKGKKSFMLKSEDEFGYNIECINGDGVVKYNNFLVIDWLNEGKHVYLESPPIMGSTDFAKYDKVNIRKAKKKESQKMDSTYRLESVVTMSKWLLELFELQWIPVTVRFPEVDQEVLVSEKGKIKFAFYEKQGDNFFFFTQKKGMLYYSDVTHWMPLPEPPKQQTSCVAVEI